MNYTNYSEYDNFFSKVRQGNLFYPPLNEHNHAADAQVLAEFDEYLNAPSFQPSETILYLHIPFCKTHCAFCMWEVRLGKEGSSQIDGFCDVLKAEARYYGAKNSIKSTRITSIFVGGGTPSMMNMKQTKDLFVFLNETFDFSHVTEISFEFELQTMNEEKLLLLKDLGVTRMSFGWQTFNPEVRRRQALAPSLEDYYTITGLLHKHQMPFSTDQMYCLPHQTTDDCHEDLETHLANGIPAIDLYKYEHNPYTKNYNNKKLDQAYDYTEEEKRALYQALRHQLLDAGWQPHIAQQLFDPAYPQAACAQLKRLWTGNCNQLSLGPRVWGNLGKYYFINQPGLDNYMRTVTENDQFAPLGKVKACSTKQISNIALVLSPRTLQIDKSVIDADTLDAESHKLSYLMDRGYMYDDGELFRFTRKGADYWSTISEFFVSDICNTDRKLFFIDKSEAI